MNHSFKIDPTKKDYQIEDGKPVIDKGLKTPAYFRMSTKRNTWLYAPSEKFGSDFHLIKKNITSSDNMVLVNTAEKALEPIIEDGRATDVVVDSSVNSRGTAEVAVTITDNQGEEETVIYTPIGV